MHDWNACYERRETPWDKGEPTPVLAEVAQRHPTILTGRVFVPGCGLGHDARWLADRGCEVTGVDIAELAVEGAKALDDQGRIAFHVADLFDLPADLQSAFDVVWEHTCLCALPPDLRAQYALGVKSALRPGGTVAGVFFINPEMDPGEQGPPFGIDVGEVEALWREVGLEPIDAWTPQTGYEGRVGRELAMVLRHRL